VIGGRTLEELNTPLSQRLLDLETNLERWRWLPRDLGPRHILVNVAGYEMELVDGGRRVLSMKVVVGEEGWETPVFADTLDHIVFNPYWNVPASIAESSLLPQVKSDPNHLERNNFEVVDRSGSSPRVVDPSSIDWSGIAIEDFPYFLRQRPGSDNALGLVKFMFPNEYNIYLHDSPADYLFSEARRAYSHGCVRLEKPFELARLLLEIDSDRSDEEIDGFLDQDGERHVNLRGTVPIYIVYLTTWVDDDGTTRFHHDPYHNDRNETTAAQQVRPPEDGG
jgi:L,D-transpeptidase YcbB